MLSQSKIQTEGQREGRVAGSGFKKVDAVKKSTEGKGEDGKRFPWRTGFFPVGASGRCTLGRRGQGEVVVGSRGGGGARGAVGWGKSKDIKKKTLGGEAEGTSGKDDYRLGSH